MIRPNVSVCPGCFAGGEIPPGVFHQTATLDEPEVAGRPYQGEPYLLDGHPDPELPEPPRPERPLENGFAFEFVPGGFGH